MNRVWLLPGPFLFQHVSIPRPPTSYTHCRPRLPPSAGPTSLAIPRAFLLFDVLRGIADRTEDVALVDLIARGPAASEAGVTDAYAWLLRRKVFVIQEHGLGEGVWVDDEVLESVPHQTLLA